MRVGGRIVEPFVTMLQTRSFNIGSVPEGAGPFSLSPAGALLCKGGDPESAVGGGSLEIDPAVVRSWERVLEEMFEGMDDLFVRSEPRRHMRSYVRGLLSDLPRKNIWHLAEQAGMSCPDGLQALLAQSPWDEGIMRDRVRALAVAALGEGDGVLIVDETADIKKGVKTVGVQRQHAGITGQVENCQTSVHLSYGSSRGRTIIDSELYVGRPWVDDPERCAGAEIPDARARTVLTKPALARLMVERALAAEVAFRWFCADEAYGHNRALRAWLEEQDVDYVLAVPKTESLPLPDGREREARHLIALAPPECWERRSCADGSKGPRLYDWAHVELAPTASGKARWVLARRSTIPNKKGKNGELVCEVAYFIVHAPQSTTFTELVAAAGLRWMVEETFQLAKSEVGFDEHEVRKWHSWYRHTVLCTLAMAFLVTIRSRPIPTCPAIHPHQPDGP